MLASAEAAAADDAHRAAVGYRRVEGAFKGLPAADKAAAALDALMKDKKREVEAGDMWEKTREKAKNLKPDQQAAAFRAFAKKYEGTKAGEKALAAAVKAEAQQRR